MLPVHRNDEGRGQRRRWAFFSNLLMGSMMAWFSEKQQRKQRRAASISITGFTPVLFSLLAAAVFLLATVSEVPAAGTRLDRLRGRIEAVIPSAQGPVGVSIQHLESGAVLAINGREAFPMASAFKLPLLVELYAMAKEGALRWEDMVEISSADQHLGSSGLTAMVDPPGVVLSIRNLVNLMMIASDNSAADLCLGKAGAANVTARMRSLEIGGIRVDRSCQELILDYRGLDTATLKHLARDDLRNALRDGPHIETEEMRFAADDRFAADPRDSATPDAMVRLLCKIWNGQAVDRASSEAILEILRRCSTGKNRLRGLLPPSTEVAHKTGTIGGVINDVGIISLPDDAGHVAIAVMTKRARASYEQVERTIADIARYAYDYFCFTAE